jgi:DNA-binding transcriptional LysR family regulator
MIMNLNQLKVFHITAKVQSFTRAAEALFLTQPGISKHIKDLEEDYGLRLFDRLGKRVVLTQAGEVLYTSTEKIFNIIDQTKVEIDEFRGLDRGTLNIGASITIGTYILPDILGRFRRAYPRLNISLDISLNREIVEKVLSNALDIGLLGAPTDDERLAMKLFFKDELAVIVPRGHEWALRDSVRPQDLLTQPFILTQQGSGTRVIVEERLKEAGIFFRNELEFGNTEAVKKAVEAGLGISIVSRHAVLREERQGLIKSLRLSGVNLERHFYITYRKDKYLSKLLEAFMQFLIYNP